MNKVNRKTYFVIGGDYGVGVSHISQQLANTLSCKGTNTILVDFSGQIDISAHENLYLDEISKFGDYDIEENFIIDDYIYDDKQVKKLVGFSKTSAIHAINSKFANSLLDLLAGKFEAIVVDCGSDINNPIVNCIIQREGIWLLVVSSQLKSIMRSIEKIDLLRKRNKEIAAVILNKFDLLGMKISDSELLKLLPKDLILERNLSQFISSQVGLERGNIWKIRLEKNLSNFISYVVRLRKRLIKAALVAMSSFKKEWLNEKN